MRHSFLARVVDVLITGLAIAIAEVLGAWDRVFRGRVR
jgi:hypothetical protein